MAPLMFRKEEAFAFLTAEKIIEKSTDLQNVQSFKSGMNKIKAWLRYIDKDYISDMEHNISVVGKNTESEYLPFAITQCILKRLRARNKSKLLI